MAHNYRIQIVEDQYFVAMDCQQALEDAFSDGMDIVTLSLSEGYPISVGPLDKGSACGLARVPSSPMSACRSRGSRNA